MNRIDLLRAIAIKHSGQYADGYIFGLDVADKALEPATDLKAFPAQFAQGYRDGLNIRPWRVKSGKSAAKNRELVAKHRARKRETHVLKQIWVQK